MKQLMLPITRWGLLILIITACNLPVSGTGERADTTPNTGFELPKPGEMVDEVTQPAHLPTQTPSSLPTSVEPGLPIWGRLANPGFENQRIKTSLFFSGQARDGNTSYGCRVDENMGLYTVHPEDQRHLQWSERRAYREFVLNSMVEIGLNVVSMSSWGEDFLPCSVGWPRIAPMQTAPQSHDELFEAAVKQSLLIIPFIESRDDWALRNEFPLDFQGNIAPGAVSQILNLIERYLQNPAHPEWADRWAQVYNRSGDPYYAISFIHASSNRLGPTEHRRFAEGFDNLSQLIFEMSGFKVGFFLDPLPPGSNAPGNFKPTPEGSGPFLLESDSILGIQAFIPEIWISGWPSEAQMLTWKQDFSRRWESSGIPFLMDISPGYDASVVFPSSISYGFTERWVFEVSLMVDEYSSDGLVFNSWNGYTEGMAAVPTKEFGDVYSEWLKQMVQVVNTMD